jgi:2-C-methyl-D-erythritol 4-phosphate cytidylyltransferase / 2-C-methyl-D-erythritol 2,4-cyclodiphosphate synthase
MSLSYWVVLPAAGAGRRMGSTVVPKQYLRLDGRTILEHAVAPFLADDDCRGVVLALAADDFTFPTLPLASDPRIHTTPGGAQRRDSVLAGLRYLSAYAPAQSMVLVHDAARPCLSAADLAALKAALTHSADGALLALRVADTVKRADDGDRVSGTVPRDGLWRAQTPQGFPLGRLIAALEACPGATDESSAVEATGGRPRLVAGSPDNLKITEPADLVAAVRSVTGGSPVREQRVGFGIDVHAFGEGDHVWLGGVRIPHERGVVAHSDGDVLLHALCDALLGAVGLGDIGQHFPDSDPRWKGAASVQFLRHVLAQVAERGFAPVNVDVTVLCEAPRLSPYRNVIRATLASELRLSEDRVNIKATTTEKLGYLGRREGLEAHVVALVASRS